METPGFRLWKRFLKNSFLLWFIMGYGIQFLRLHNTSIYTLLSILSVYNHWHWLIQTSIIFYTSSLCFKPALYVCEFVSVS